MLGRAIGDVLPRASFFCIRGPGCFFPTDASGELARWRRSWRLPGKQSLERKTVITDALFRWRTLAGACEIGPAKRYVRIPT